MDIKINCHSSICIENEIYVDPYKIRAGKKNAAIVFITHPHYDHLEKSSIREVMNEKTIFVCPIDAKKPLEELGIDEKRIIIAKPNEKFSVGKVEVETFPSYNIDKAFHKKEYGWLGYVLTLNKERCLICGDCDATDELRAQRADIMIVPIGGTYTMDATAAARAVNEIMPKVVIPDHYNLIVGNKDDEKTFLSLLDKRIEAKVLI